jgi:hypothetical protein
MMTLTENEREFLGRRHAAAMITLRPDGTPHAVRVGVALVDGKLWSSGTETRARTGFLRRDPRSTLFLWDEGFNSLTLETTVTILDGSEVPERSLRLFQVMQADMSPPPLEGNVIWNGEEKSPDDFRRIMVEEHRLIYEFDVNGAYGLH